MRLLLIALSILIAKAQLYAQTDDEYRMEIGAGVGLIGYLGDFNSSITGSLQPMGTVLARYLMNPYTAIRLSASYGKLKGSSDETKTFYPDYNEQTYTFSNTLIDLSLTYEYNFWPYGTGRDYRGAKRFTPFIFGGIGMTAVSGTRNVITANVPIGLGLKYKLGERLNIGMEWGMHFAMNDELDGVKDPYKVKSSGMFKNTDCYSALQITLTYSFLPKCRTCHNADE